MLTRPFLEYCIWENLPRTILMYYVNFVSSPEGYFHTVICNTDDFRNTTISHDLHYIAWDTPPKQHPRTLSIKDFDKMVKSGAPFARKFPKDDPVLDKIDRELLNRTESRFAPGAWCMGSSGGGDDPCYSRGEDSVFRPGPGAERLGELMKKLASEEFRNGSCSAMKFDQTKRVWATWYTHKMYIAVVFSFRSSGVTNKHLQVSLYNNSHHAKSIHNVQSSLVFSSFLLSFLIYYKYIVKLVNFKPNQT